MGVSMHGNVRISAPRMCRLHAFTFLIDTLQAGGHRFEPGTLHPAMCWDDGGSERAAICVCGEECRAQR